MRKNQRNYEFRERLMTPFRENVRDEKRLPNENELVLEDGFAVDISNANTQVVLTAAKDFQDYMLISMNVSVMITKKGNVAGNKVIKVSVDENADLGVGNGYMGYRLTVGDDITIVAHDERGAAQAFYHLEDLMSLRRAPYLEKGVEENRAMYSPRMIHSGYGIDQFPDCHLRDIAHAGMDAILVFVKGTNKTTMGYLDFNELIARAAKWGIDVYAYSYLKSEMHPDDEGAYEHYDKTYGNFFRACPGVKGIVFVGESIEFPSKDEHVSPLNHRENVIDGIPTGKISPGWWPCKDYPQWLNLVKTVIRKEQPEADIVFWSYNWNWAPAEDRIALIRKLPKDISLLVTYEMGHIYEQDGIKVRPDDYTLSFEGPGYYFQTEAEAAKECGIRLYSMTNTGGRTWDFGTAPYEPFPYQWKKRYDGMKHYWENNGLCGLMESHHFGFYPSFISEYAKWNFTVTNKPRPNILQELIASIYGDENVEKIDDAMKLWSEAINMFIAADIEQYGPFRVGPAYPMCLHREIKPPAADYAHFGNRIMNSKYDPFGHENGNIALIPIRMREEHKSLKKMEELLLKGIEVVESIKDMNDDLEELLEIVKYMRCTVRTAINMKEFIFEKVGYMSSVEVDDMEKHINKMEEIVLCELENAESAIPYVQKNSALGFEPSMEYLGDEWHIRWKIRQTNWMLNSELRVLKNGLKNSR